MSTRSLLGVLAVVVLGAAAPAGSASAQSRARDDAPQLRRRVVLLEDRVATLERQIAALQEEMQAQREAQRAAAGPPGPSYLHLSRTDGWRDRENWRFLRRGLTQLEVRYLLGAPGGVDAGDLFTVWYYPDPRGGSVRFDALGGRVDSWSEPW